MKVSSNVSIFNSSLFSGRQTSKWNLAKHTVGGVILLLCSFCFPVPTYAFETFSCEEIWFEASLREVIASDRIPDRRQKCATNKLDESVKEMGYQVMGDRAYRFSTWTTRTSPCTGVGVGALGQIFNPVCYLPHKLQNHHTRTERKLWLTSTDGNNFRVLESNLAGLTPEQQRQVDSYALDSTSVYHYSEKLKDADPSSFEVFFPSSSGVNLTQYSFAKDHRYLFVDGAKLPSIDMNEVEWIEVLCTDEAKKCNNYDYGVPIIGRIKRNILILNGGRPTLISNIETSKISCSRKKFELFCTINGRRYMVDPGIGEEARLVIQKED